MKKLYITIVLVCIWCSNGLSQTPIAKLPVLKALMSNTSDTTYIINFWATWCAPCVKELPELKKIDVYCENKNCKVILISLDFAKDIEKVSAFVTKNSLRNVTLLDETKYHQWIDLVDPSWGGAIPATLLIKNDKNFRKFYEKSITFDEIQSQIKPYIK
ncbi:MAG: TlpA disulfide reductase family protein [Cytophagales bacterium]|nr:TlpA disulfide reductase family protein [Cytophagales bacterium]